MDATPVVVDDSREFEQESWRCRFRNQAIHLLQSRHTLEIEIFLNLVNMALTFLLGYSGFMTLYNMVLMYLWYTRKFSFDQWSVVYLLWNNVHNWTHGFEELTFTHLSTPTMTTDDVEHIFNFVMRFAFLTAVFGKIDRGNAIAMLSGVGVSTYYCWDRVWYPGRMKIPLRRL